MTVGLQLYSMRDCADQIALLGQLPDMGITQVEGFGGVFGDPSAYRAAMDANGITMPSGHMGLAEVEADFDGTIDIITTLGISRVFAPYLEEKDRPTSAQGYADLAARLNDAAKRYADKGLSFGWHNHDFEFVALPDGAIPMDILLERAPDITWEADLAWIVRGGADPMAYVKAHGSRINAVHVKDIATAGTNLDEDGWANLSAGTMDWAGLLQACRRHCAAPVYALEHDKPSDPVAYARASAAAFKTLWETTHG